MATESVTDPGVTNMEAQEEQQTSVLQSSDGAANMTTQLVVDELLCFVMNKMQVLPPDTIIQLSTSVFKSEEIEASKRTLTSCVVRPIKGSNLDREIRRMSETWRTSLACYRKRARRSGQTATHIFR